MRILFACVMLLAVSVNAARSQTPKEKAESSQWRLQNVKVDATYFAYRGLNLKSLSLEFLDPPVTGKGLPILGRLVYLLEFERDTWDYDLDGVQREIAPQSKKLRHIFFNGDNIAINAYRFYDYRIQGEVSGIKGEAFRVIVEFPVDPNFPIGDVKKIVVRPW